MNSVKFRRVLEPASVHDSVSALSRLLFKTVWRSVIPSGIASLCCMIAVPLFILLSAILPSVLYGGEVYAVEPLYAAAAVFFSAMFCAISLSDDRDIGFGGDMLYFAPFPPFINLLVRSSVSAIPSMMVLGTIFFSSFGLIHTLFGVGLSFLLLCTAGFVLTAISAVLMNTAIRTLRVIFGIRRIYAKVFFAAIYAVWLIMALLLTPYVGIGNRLCDALISPVGTTIPVGGWICAVIMGICEGSFSTAVPGILLFPSGSALIVLYLCIITRSQYDLTLAFFADGGSDNGGNRGDIPVGGFTGRIASVLSRIIPFGGVFTATVLRSVSGYCRRIPNRAVCALYVPICCILFALSSLGYFSVLQVLAVSLALAVILRLGIYDEVSISSEFGNIGTLIDASAAALIELPGCILLSVITFMPVGIIIGASVSAVVLTCAVYVLAASAVVFGRRILSCFVSDRLAASALASAAALAAVIAVCLVMQVSV